MIDLAEIHAAAMGLDESNRPDVIQKTDSTAEAVYTPCVRRGRRYSDRRLKRTKPPAGHYWRRRWRLPG